MVDIEHDHLGRRAGLAPDLIRAGRRVGAAHEADRPTGGTATAELLHRGADVPEVHTRTRAALEDLAFFDGTN